MSLPRTVAEVLREHVTLEVEGVDRITVPALRQAGGVASFFRFHLQHWFASSCVDGSDHPAFIAQMEQFAQQAKVPIVTFGKGQRKDDAAAEYRRGLYASE
jgi:hypothetical protein